MKKLLFTGQMMLAYNQDRKRQTRRVATGIQPGVPRKPAYEPGSIVVLASTWAVAKRFDQVKPTEIDIADLYSALFWYDGWTDYAQKPIPKPTAAGKSRPGRFLPKTLYTYMPKARIVAAKLEPVQAISEADALADGGWQYSSCPVHKNPVASFALLWDSINKKRGYGWDDNPFVWAYTLEPVSEVGDG